jgi:hypothetical protein
MLRKLRTMPPKLSAEGTKTVNLILSLELARAVDEFRRNEPDVPNTSAALRRLIEAGLKANAKPRKKS